MSTAKAKLTLAEQELIQKRMEAVVIIDDRGIESSWETDSESHGEGPSSGKGKGIDPRNWRAVHLDEDKTDADAQKKAFAFWNKVHKDKSKALQQAYDEQSKQVPSAPPLTPVKPPSGASQTQSFEVVFNSKPENPLLHVDQPVSVPLEPVPEPVAAMPDPLSTSSPRPKKAKPRMPKNPSVTIEEVMDEDEIEYLI
ncbi:hypothetical protein F5146DRAFT_1139598 [Armillaria mellea]|nr:hypothetical protein F5146DRAFT_1139598 [Armillaria mellea]